MTIPWDEASRCPRDGTQGKIVFERAAKDALGHVNGVLKTLECGLESCEYSKTGWLVQVRPDGTIPDPPEKRDKFFQSRISEANKQAIRDMLAAQAEAELRPGAEVRNPYG